MAWLIPRQSSVVSTHSTNQNVSVMEEYKGKARVVFEWNSPSDGISHDFLVVLASSQKDGIKFDRNHEGLLSEIIDDFRKRINKTASELCLEETCNIHIASVTLRRIEKSSSSLSPSYLLEVSGRLEYTFQQNADILKNQHAIESSHSDNDKRDKNDLSTPSTKRGKWWCPSTYFSWTSTAPTGDASKYSATPELQPTNCRWKKNFNLVVGSDKGMGTMNELRSPHAVVVDPFNDRLYIADSLNHRIFAWRRSDSEGYTVAGSNGQASLLNNPTDVVLDINTQSLLICDSGNKRIVRWLIDKHSSEGETVISNICCHGLAMDKDRNIYVTDVENHEVRRYMFPKYSESTVVAGGCGKGHNPNQLNTPHYVVVDEQSNIYVSDFGNNRVVKWSAQATVGITVAGDGCSGTTLNSVDGPMGIVVDKDNRIYVVETNNHRITLWSPGSNAGKIIAGGHGRGIKTNQLSSPINMSLDRKKNLYVVDGSNRILSFEIEKDYT